jgi:hypothetical protein
MIMSHRFAAIVRTILAYGLVFRMATTAQKCPMEMWVFDTIIRCNNNTLPNALGTIYADGDCHSTELKDAETADYMDLFPGNYRAVCTSEGKIRFLDSGCVSETCTSRNSSHSDASTCDRNADTTSSLYSRLGVPEYIVQDTTKASVGGYYTCLRLQDWEEGATVTFVLFGDCSQSDCRRDGWTEGAESPAGETSNSPAPTRAPAAASTPAQPLTTALPTITPIDDPTGAPAEGPSTATTTESPIGSLSTHAEPPPSETVTPRPASRPNANQKAITGNTTLTLRLTPMTTELNEATSLPYWESRTREHITESATRTGIAILELTLSDVAQSLISVRRQARRELQQSSLLLDFGVSMRYLSSSTDVPSVAEIVNGAFDAEPDRLKYLRRFGNAEPFNLVESVSVSVDGVPPVGIGAVKSAESGNKNGALTGIGVGAAVLVMAIAGLLYHKRSLFDANRGQLRRNTRSEEATLGSTTVASSYVQRNRQA